MKYFNRYMTAYDLLKHYTIQQIGDSVILYHCKEDINFIIKQTGSAYYKVCHITTELIDFQTFRTVFELFEYIGSKTPKYKYSFDRTIAFPRKGLDKVINN